MDCDHTLDACGKPRREMPRLMHHFHRKFAQQPWQVFEVAHQFATGMGENDISKTAAIAKLHPCVGVDEQKFFFGRHLPQSSEQFLDKDADPRGLAPMIKFVADDGDSHVDGSLRIAHSDERLDFAVTSNQGGVFDRISAGNDKGAQIGKIDHVGIFVADHD